ncbi:hypothetical protein [Streptomyces cyaneofuscatus]|uniref:hypothetical protein n=1 Tax=Streptomyces cyaneofuscatus TaxID=66883 RepID=UPI0036DBBDA5
MAFSYRLCTLQLLSEWRFQQPARQRAQLGYRRGEPGSTMVRENSKLISKVFESLRADEIPVADLSKAVHIYPEELNHYVFGLAPISICGGE